MVENIFSVDNPRQSLSSFTFITIGTFFKPPLATQILILLRNHESITMINEPEGLLSKFGRRVNSVGSSKYCNLHNIPKFL